MAFNLFAVKPKGDKPKVNIFNIPTIKKEPVKKEEEVKEAVSDVVEVTEEVATEEAIVEKTIKEEKSVEESVEEKIPEVKEETTSVEAPAEKKKRGRKTKSQEEKEESAAEESSSNSFINVKFAPSSIKLNDLKKTFAVNFEDEAWEKKKEELEKRVDNIRIEPDINLGSVRILLAQCTNLYSDLKSQQRSNKTFYTALCDKNLGILERQKQVNAFGKNTEDRKKNSILSCEQFKLKDSDNKEYNIYDMAMVIQDRVDAINDMLDDVKQKKETLISYLAVLKMENGMVK